MAQTRKVSYVPEFKGSFILPTGAGTGKYLASNSEGKAEWIEETDVVEKSWAIAGEVKAETLPGFFVKIKSGEKKKIIEARYKIEEGTEVVAELKRNGSAIEAYKELKVKSTAASTTSVVELSNEDYVNLVLKSPSGTPKIATITVYIEIYT
jgi:hypothetical protein